MHLHKLFDIAGGVVMGCSLLYSFLPPYETFDGYPRFQKFYKVFTQIIARWGGLNLKSVVYPQIKSLGNMNDAAAIERRIEQSSVEEPLPDPAPPKKAPVGTKQ